MSAEDLADKVIDLATAGMLTDGAHHKQWFLEEIAKLAAGGEMEPATGRSADGSVYHYERRSRGPLTERLAAQRVYFDDDHQAERPVAGDYWEIVVGIVP